MSLRTAKPGSLPTERDAVRIGALWVDRTPVTNRRYAAFVAATRHRAPAFWSNGAMPASLSEHPVVGVDFFDVLAYARWAGGFPPTLEEWLLAAGLDEAQAYPWGDRFDSERCNTVRSAWRGTSPVDAHASGASPSGCLDLCGNVWELTCTPAPDDSASVLAKGGSWYDYPVHAKLDAKPFRARLHRAGATIGFRLVYGSPQVADFLPEEVTDRGIAFRRRQDGDAGESEAHADWTDTVAELRRAAATKVDLSEVARETETAAAAAVDEVNDFFDRAESEPAPEQAAPHAAPQQRRRLEDWRERGGRLLDRIERLAPRLRLESPLLLLALVPAILIALWMVYAAVVSGNDEWQRAEIERSTGTEPRVAAPEPEPETPSPPERLVRAIGRLDSPSIARRMEAERDLLDRPRESLPLVIAELRASPGDRALRSLRYVYSVLADGRGRAAQITDSQPTSGLVFVFDRFDAETRKLGLLARRTARAEAMDFAAVYTGRAGGEAVVEMFSQILEGGDIYMDSARPGFADHFAVDGPPELLGLDGEGGILFRRSSGLRRERLLKDLAKLHDIGR